MQGVLFNCSARLERNRDGIFEPMGNCTEQGLIKYLQAAGVAAHEVIRKKDDHTLAIIPFNSRRKRACSAVALDGSLARVFLKGAPEIVIEHCTHYFDQDGARQPITVEKKAYLLQEVVANTFAKRAYRTIMIASRDLTIDGFENLKQTHNGFKSEHDREVLEKEMTVVGIFALQDPLRDEIVESVKICKRAGINIRMVTGDNLETAKAIAIDAGIISQSEADQQYVCMEGKAFRERCGGLKRLEDHHDANLVRESVGDMHMFKAVQAKLKVLARSTPEDKYMLVTGLKELNQVVAVTGDGTNDAPALKKADVGFAMGITGTGVAKEASDIILLDDNFASIITAIRWGRNIYTNVRKFLQFQLTTNCVAMFIVFLGGVVVSEPPLTSVQMLWVNLIMDTCGALALATEPPSEDVLLEQPYQRTERIVTPVMWRNIIGQALYQAVVLVIFLFWGRTLFGYTYAEELPFFVVDPVTGGMVATEKTEHYTVIFNTFVFMQVFNEINSRKLGDHEYNVFKGFFNNFLFLSIIIGTAIVQICLVQYGGQPVRTSPLTVNQHLMCIAFGAFSLVQGKFLSQLLCRCPCEDVPAHQLVRLARIQGGTNDRRGSLGIHHYVF